MQGYFLCPLIFAQCLRHGEQGLYNPFFFCLITHSRFLVTRTKTDLIAFLQPANDAVSLRLRYREGGASGSNITGNSYSYGFNEKKESNAANSPT